MSEDNVEKLEGRRLAFMVSVVVLVIAVVVALVFFIIPKNDGDTVEEVKSDVEITSTEISALETLSFEILQKIGNFGIRSDVLTADNALEVEYIAAQTPNDGGIFFTSRQTAYESIRDNVLSGSPIDYPARTVSEWVNNSEIEGLVSFEVIWSTIEAQSKGSHTSVSGVEHKTAYVDVTFTSKETMRHATADDSTWDGSYNVLSKDFPNNTARLTFVQDENLQWKLYSLTGLEYQFLLATWETPNSDSFVNTQHDFSNEGILQRTVPFSPPPIDE